jgi:predicted membrane channel-forming protein YqfA (hemolysin III family)
MSFGQSDCERIADAALAQPVSALTSLGYVVAGIVAVAWAARTRSFMATIAAVALVAVGFGSFAFHGPQPSWAQPAHDWPIIALGVVLAIGLLRSTIRQDWSGWGAPAAIFALGLAVYAAGRSGSPFCDPDSLWQLHAIWHVLTAAAALAAIRAMAAAGSDETFSAGR